MIVFKEENQLFLSKNFNIKNSYFSLFTILIAFRFNGELLDETEMGEFIPHVPSQLLDPVPLKPKGEVLLKAKCFVPEAKSAPLCKVGFSIGTLSKALLVFGNRFWVDTISGKSKSMPEPFKVLDISWENAFGGPNYDKNPLGKGFASSKTDDGHEIWPLPNIEDPSQPIVDPRDRPEPAGFLPYEVSWPQRAKKLGTFDEKWSKERWPWFPNDFNPAFFNAAPSDQQIDGYFQGDEEIVFENMHPELSLIKVNLPGIRTRCFLNLNEKNGTVFKEVKLNLDTLFFIPHEEIGILFWHGTIPVNHAEVKDIEQVLLVTERLEDPKEPAYYRNLLEQKLKAFFVETDTDESQKSEINQHKTDRLKKKELFTPGEQKLLKFAEEKAKEAEEKLKKRLRELGYEPDEILKKAQEEVPDTDDFDTLISWAEARSKEQEHALYQRLRELGHKDPKKFLKEKRKQSLKDLKNFSLIKQIEDLKGLLLANNLWNKDWEAKIELMLEDAKETERELKWIIDSIIPVEAEEFENAIKNKEKDFSNKDLSALDLTERNLEAFSFRDANLENVKFVNANLKDTDFTNANLSGVDFTGADLTGANLSGCEASNAIFNDTKLSKANLTYGNFSNAKFENVNLIESQTEGADFSKTVWEQCSLESITGESVSFFKSVLKNTSFSQAFLSYADFSECELEDVDFSEVVAPNITFDGTKGENVTFSAANLFQSRADENSTFTKANFKNADLRSACWEGTTLEQCNFEGAILDGGNFSGCRFLYSNFYHVSAKEVSFKKSLFSKTKLTASNLFRSCLEDAVLKEIDFRGSNLYEVEFWKAHIEKAVLEGANLKMTKLFKKVLT